MEVKKNPKIDLVRKRGMFLNVGLAISLSLVLASFEWIRTEDSGIVILPEEDSEFEELIEIPNTVIPPPPKPKPIEMPVIVEVDESEEIEEVEFHLDTESTEDLTMVDVPVLAMEEEVADVIFDIVEQEAEPFGGINAFYAYVGKNIKYPKQAKRMGIEGRVFVQFVVDKDGSIIDVRAIKGIGGGCDEEAVKILQNSPKWNPGKQRGRPVKVRRVLPITFQLN